MTAQRLNRVFAFLALLATTVTAATPRPKATGPYGYQGYNLTRHGDQNSTIYETASTPILPNTTYSEPDVFLNASVHVGEISLVVDDIRAKVNLEAQVLQLLKFNAGVDASIDRVRLLIENVQAKVILEARLENLVLMIGDVLHSLDLNPIIATLGNDLSHLINTTVSSLDGNSAGMRGAASPPRKNQPQQIPTKLSARSLKLQYNILYSVNDYSGNNHMNRVLAKNGDVVDEFLDNHGHVYDKRVVGTYKTDMQFTGHELNVLHDGIESRELEYRYNPFPGLEVISAIYVDERGTVVGTQVLSESGGGGTSTIEGEL